jgi:hypothetical protein
MFDSSSFLGVSFIGRMPLLTPTTVIGDRPGLCLTKYTFQSSRGFEIKVFLLLAFV